jgi:type I restriction enzyme S subunit
VKGSTVHLADVCEVNPSTRFHFADDELCSFVPMEAVSDESAQIANSALRPFREVAKGYTIFTNGDVIVAKITPCMENGKCAIARNLRNSIGFGSTEFHVLRATPQILPEWLFYFWRFPQTRKRAEKNMTGTAGQKRVPSSFLERLEIPVPPLREQKRIAALLEKADRLRRTRRYARQLSDTFLQSVFLEMFGDALQNSRNWDMETLGKKLNFLTSGSRGWAKYYRESGDLFLRIQNVGKNRLLLDDLIFVQPPKNAEGSRTVVQPGDVLLSITADLGRAAVVPKDLPKAYINQHLALLRLRDIDPVFAAALLSSSEAKRQWDSLDRSAVKSGLNFDDIRGFKMISPPLPLQQKFRTIVRRFERLRAQQREAERQAEHLFQTLLHRAFNDGVF